jgi:hypothetical protein
VPTILRIEFNVPVEVALQNEAGVSVAGRYSDRVMYTLSDGRTIYVPPFVALRISELGIRAGEPFRICKRHLKTGQRKTVEWSVERVDADAETQLERDLRESIEVANSQNDSRPPPHGANSVIAIPLPPTKASEL